MVSEIYSSFTKFGGKPYLILKQGGRLLCSSFIRTTDGTFGWNVINFNYRHGARTGKGESSIDGLSRETGINVISAMPCYCDIQFSKKE